MEMTFMQALALIEAVERPGRQPLEGTQHGESRPGDDLRAALGVVAEAGLAAPNPSGERATWVAKVRDGMAELRNAVAAKDPAAVSAAWGRIRVLWRERARSE